MAEKNATVKVLHHLKRRFGRERAQLDKSAADTYASTPFRDRCAYEANQWSMAMSMLDEEIRKAK